MSSEQNTPGTPSNTVSTITKRVDTNPKVVPSQFASTFVDKAMIAIDESAELVTMTLLQRHFHPQVSPNGWILSEENWEIIGELKMPLTEMNAIAVYYLSTISGGMDIYGAVQQYLNEHPKEQETRGNYGPTGFQVTQEPQK
jgi:hypothetical protein